MDFVFQTVLYDGATFLDTTLPAIPKGAAVYKIFDIHDNLIVLNKTSNLAERLQRFFGPHSELVKDLDLRKIASRVEYVRTFSPFETTYALYLERRRHFPKSYRRMKTFRYFTLMKINRKQRFPRIYASRQIKAGVEYFGPFLSRGQFARMKTLIERTFKLRPCMFNIRGNDPHPDCIYFQMHTCSRPCNNDIDRNGYQSDVSTAVAFIQGLDATIEEPLFAEMTELAVETRFEEAEDLRKKLDKLRRARQEMKDTFPSLNTFHYMAALPADSTSRVRLVVVRGGRIVAFKQYETSALREALSQDLEQWFAANESDPDAQWQYDEFCLVSNFMVKSLQSVQFIPFRGVGDAVVEIEKSIRSKKRRKPEVL